MITSVTCSHARRNDSLLFRNSRGGGLSTVLIVARIVLRTSTASSLVAASGFELKNAWYLSVSKNEPSSLVDRKGTSAGKYYRKRRSVDDLVESMATYWYHNTDNSTEDIRSTSSCFVAESGAPIMALTSKELYVDEYKQGPTPCTLQTKLLHGPECISGLRPSLASLRTIADYLDETIHQIPLNPVRGDGNPSI